MPELTITVSDDDLARLCDAGAQLGTTVEQLGAAFIHRGLMYQRAGPRPNTQAQAAARALRQLELARVLRARGETPMTWAEKQRLAQHFGVTERTLYRDLLEVTRDLGLVPPDARRTRPTPQTRTA